MAKTKLVFLGTEKSNTEHSELEVFATVNNEIRVQIQDTESRDPSIGFEMICLDKATAIKLVKVLKHNISMLETEGGQNVV